MKANKLLKHLSKNNNYLQGMPTNVTKLLMRFMTAKKSEINGLAPCQFFDFGTVNEETLLEEFESAFEAYLEGFLRLPAPLCVFEHRMENISYPGVSKDPRIKGDIVFFYATPQGFNQLMSALTVDNPCSDFERIDFTESGTADERSIIGTYLLHYTKQSIQNKIDNRNWGFVGGFDQINFEESKTKRARAGSFIKVLENFDGDPELVSDTIFVPLFVFLARLNARGMERQMIHAPERLNKSRIKKGIAPYVSYTKVSINPYHQTLGHSGPRNDEEYTPKRYHFRRGHVRHFHNGQKTWVRPCFVGTPELGSIEHTYQVNI